ncbi:MAG TPA: DUF6298 domain-containing protein [Candidatus Krumholzibacteria bacterium]|nr:DUF6298 domain-containing protein [Candidatus Krumholzibacteria bacterium]
MSVMSPRLLVLGILSLLVACGGEEGSVSAERLPGTDSLTSIVVTPQDAEVDVGQTQRLFATGFYADGSRHDISDQVEWSSSDPSIVSVSNDEGSKGVATGAGAGSALIQVKDDGVIGGVSFGVLDRVVLGMGPLEVSPQNSRYFIDSRGRTVLLTGSHTWLDFQDAGRGNPPPEFDYNAFLSFLKQNRHNFFRLWTWEQSRWTLETADDQYWFNPTTPFVRSGPGVADDGLPKFDLSQFDQNYFDRLRQRVLAARANAIYVSIMLFNGWSVVDAKGNFSYNNPWHGHPFKASNNINGINGDLNGNDSGEETHELANPAITAIQEAYVKKVIDNVNDLDNVLFEISNESNSGSMDWQNHMVEVIKQYEAGLPDQHPVGITVEWPNGDNSALFASEADWISPNGGIDDPPAADGSKVILDDTDHLCGICGDRYWVWKSFLRGRNPIFMDGYDGQGYGVGGEGFNFDDPTWVSLRANMGYVAALARRLPLNQMVPSGALASTGYCLAKASSEGPVYLVYLPSGGSVTVDLSATGQATLQVEWLDPIDGTTSAGDPVTGGRKIRFSSPLSADAVLHIHA